MNTKVFFEAHPIFSYSEFFQFMQENGVHKPTSCRQQLSYHHKVGNLVHIRKNLYAVKSTSINEKYFWIDPFLIAGKSTLQSIICYHSALELLNIAYSTFEELTFLTNRPIKPFVYQNQRFKPVLFPKALVKQGRETYGVTQIERAGVAIKITNLERTIVDVLDRADLGGGWEEIWRSLDNVLHFNIEQLIEYTLLLNNATTISKVGFFLEQRPIHLAIESNFIEKLLPHIPKQPHYMNRNRNYKGKYLEKWNLIVPLEIIERQWEEPNVRDI